MVRWGAGRPKAYRRRVIFTTSAEADLYDEFTTITDREGRPTSHVLQELMLQYVKTHGSGNPSFAITKWIEQPEFRADPAVREKNEKWDKYLSECDPKDLQQLEGTFQLRAKQARKAWLEKNKL